MAFFEPWFVPVSAKFSESRGSPGNNSVVEPVHDNTQFYGDERPLKRFTNHAETDLCRRFFGHDRDVDAPGSVEIAEHGSPPSLTPCHGSAL